MIYVTHTINLSATLILKMLISLKRLTFGCMFKVKVKFSMCLLDFFDSN
jgi:hypothetical protein